MKDSEKKMIIILIIVAVLVIGGITLFTRNKGNNEQAGENETNESVEEFVEVQEDGTRLNVSTKLHETKTLAGMEISNFRLADDGSQTLLLGTITNVSDTVQGDYTMQLKVIDKNGGEIVTVPAYIKELQPGESAQLNISSTLDFANAYDFTVTR